MSWSQIFYLVGNATLQTLFMVFFSAVFSVILGLPLGVLMCVTDSVCNIMPMPVLNKVLNRIVDVLRSFPFLILMIILFPLSRLIIGTTIGTQATIVPLSIAAAPFVARIIETSLKGLDSGVIQAAKSMGSTNWQIITKVMLPECLPSLVDGFTLTVINLIGYSAMAGTVGGGGLGDLAIRYGYQRFRVDILFVSVVVILILVALIQMTGNMVSKALLKRR
ncbi:MAG: ABC transporter permease [Spirochaetia bacterium]|nr:ABC transporter permease [Spirochaetia bacterium]MDD5777117.1 ABC transporter permease [Treponema sp.]MCI5609260.1 ABC transporter permease [Spirochaetia bacterium]MCI6826241.1 ABC transporter permease [Spirochaetia bacterium]MCI7109689.1 ABC transporter permease [Spirochaetia bacterium]